MVGIFFPDVGVLPFTLASPLPRTLSLQPVPKEIFDALRTICFAVPESPKPDKPAYGFSESSSSGTAELLIVESGLGFSGSVPHFHMV